MNDTPTLPGLLFVDHEVDGFLRQRIVLAQTFQEMGFEVQIALPKETRFEETQQLNFPVHPYFLERKSTNPINDLRSLNSLLFLYRRLRPGIVHHIGVKPALYGGLAARISGVPISITTLTGLGQLVSNTHLQSKTLKKMIQRGLKLSFSPQQNRVVVQNPGDLKYLIDHKIIKHEQGLLIKGSGIDLSVFVPRPEEDGLPVIMMVSRLLWEKGIGEFIEAAKLLRDQNIKARFLLVGNLDEGHPSALPISTLQEWHNSGEVEWLGWRDDIPDLMAQSHIVCLPTYYGEGIPRVLLEAAASGRPIVATDSPGCREIVHDGENGLLVKERNVKSLADAIKQLILNPELRLTMGIKSHQIVNDFSLEKVIKANQDVYHDLLKDYLRLCREKERNSK